MFKKIILFTFLMVVISTASDWMGDETEPKNTIDVDGKTFFQISTAEELAWFAAQVNAGDSTINAFLTNDIALWNDSVDSLTTKWVPIGKNYSVNYDGTFDGNGYSISGIYVNSQGTVGFFGYIGIGGVVKNLEIKNSLIDADTTSFAGGIAGYNEGTILKCINYGNIYISTRLGIKVFAGGIVGSNSSSIGVDSCSNFGSVYASSAYFAYASGIAGGSSTKIYHSLNKGEVTAECDSCYAIANGINAEKNESYYGAYNRNEGGITATSNQKDAYASGSIGSYGINSGNVYAYSENGNAYAGGFPNIYDKKLMFCQNMGSIKAVSVNEFGYAGGISAKTGFQGISDCYNRGVVSSSHYAGGLVAYNAAYSASNGAKVLNSYSASDSIEAPYAAGVVAYNAAAASVSDCYFDSTLLPNLNAIWENAGTATDVFKMSTNDMQTDEFAWNLGPCSNYKSFYYWSRDDAYPIIVDSNSSYSPICRAYFVYDNDTITRYTNNQGHADFPIVADTLDEKIFSGWVLNFPKSGTGVGVNISDTISSSYEFSKPDLILTALYAGSNDLADNDYVTCLVYMCDNDSSLTAYTCGATTLCSDDNDDGLLNWADSTSSWYSWYQTVSMMKLQSYTSLKTQIQLKSSGRQIEITGAALGSSFSVFDLRGRIILKGEIDAFVQLIKIPHAGLYFVDINSMTLKAIVK